MLLYPPDRMCPLVSYVSTDRPGVVPVVVPDSRIFGAC